MWLPTNLRNFESGMSLFEMVLAIGLVGFSSMLVNSVLGKWSEGEKILQRQQAIAGFSSTVVKKFRNDLSVVNQLPDFDDYNFCGKKDSCTDLTVELSSGKTVTYSTKCKKVDAHLAKIYKKLLKSDKSLTCARQLKCRGNSIPQAFIEYETSGKGRTVMDVPNKSALATGLALAACFDVDSSSIGRVGLRIDQLSLTKKKPFGKATKHYFSPRNHVGVTLLE